MNTLRESRRKTKSGKIDADLYFSNARLYNVKARSLDPDNYQLKLNTAQLVVEESGDFGKALPLIESIVSEASIEAPSDEDERELSAVPEGQLSAHLLYARAMLDEELEYPASTEEREAAAQKHLEFIVRSLEHEEYQIKLLRPSEMSNAVLSGGTLRVLSMFTDSHVLLSKLLSERGSYEEALRHLKLAVQQSGSIRPDLFSAILEEIKRHADGLDELEKQREMRRFEAEFRSARTFLNRLILSRPNDIRVWAALLKCYQLSGDYDAARKQVQSAQRMMTDPRASAQLRQLLSNLFVAEAIDYDYENLVPAEGFTLEKANFSANSTRLARRSRPCRPTWPRFSSCILS